MQLSVCSRSGNRMMQEPPPAKRGDGSANEVTAQLSTLCFFRDERVCSQRPAGSCPRVSGARVDSLLDGAVDSREVMVSGAVRQGSAFYDGQHGWILSTRLVCLAPSRRRHGRRPGSGGSSQRAARSSLGAVVTARWLRVQGCPSCVTPRCRGDGSPLSVLSAGALPVLRNGPRWISGRHGALVNIEYAGGMMWREAAEEGQPARRVKWPRAHSCQAHGGLKRTPHCWCWWRAGGDAVVVLRRGAEARIFGVGTAEQG